MDALDAIRTTIDETGDEYLAEYADRIIASVRETLCFNILAATPAEIPLGVSRIGGEPDVPAEFTWPTDDGGNPLAFLFQLQLSPLADELLLVFAGKEAYPAAVHVERIPTGTPLVRMPSPKNFVYPSFYAVGDSTKVHELFATPHLLRSTLTHDIPRECGYQYEELFGDDYDVQDTYGEVLEVVAPYGDIRYGGHYAGYHDPSEDACEYHGLDESHQENWQHLVTLDSIDDSFVIGDCGYFQILELPDPTGEPAKLYGGMESS
ncbi:putative DUF1963 family protein [Corynebacterium mustelae]|uniref:Putative DUF1963 family protein n=1 Tax=Corynebacterium mustelae TaxID=571915 RepID=A0A0G3H3H2_9CORY|nr:DUF1963 domain-containing protein [Corynebacterium mustelae]AKK06378.1 putative DUF1963 family protein [Corynebacterium mustelae]